MDLGNFDTESISNGRALSIVGYIRVSYVMGLHLRQTRNGVITYDMNKQLKLKPTECRLLKVIQGILKYMT